MTPFLVTIVRPRDLRERLRKRIAHAAQHLDGPSSTC
jgi:hypothetical protein